MKKIRRRPRHEFWRDQLRRDKEACSLLVQLRASNYQAWRLFREMEYFMGLLKKIMRKQPGPGESIPIGDFPELSGFPILFEFLTADRWEDGTSRVPGAFTVFEQAGRLKASLNDKDGGNVAFITLRGSETIWEQLEQALTSDQTDWRENGPQGLRRRK